MRSQIEESTINETIDALNGMLETAKVDARFNSTRAGKDYARGIISALRVSIDAVKALRWLPMRECHGDHRGCVFINIHDPGSACVASVCDTDFWEKAGECGWTHFQPIRLDSEYAEELANESD